MALPHMSNGQKASAVACMGALSLVGVIGLAIVDLVRGEGAGHSSALMASAFTFLTVQAGGAMTYLMGASAPDQAMPAPPAPGSARLTQSVTSEVTPTSTTTTLETWTCSCGAVVDAKATECPHCHTARPST